MNMWFWGLIIWKTFSRLRIYLYLYIAGFLKQELGNNVEIFSRYSERKREEKKCGK